MAKYKKGNVVKGVVTGIESYGIFVAFDEFYTGLIHISEISSKFVKDPKNVVNIGDEIELVVLKPIKDKENGNYLLSKKRVDAKKVWVELQEKFDNNETIEAPVKNKVKGGLVVDAGVRGFVPASMID